MTHYYNTSTDSPRESCLATKPSRLGLQYGWSLGCVWLGKRKLIGDIAGNRAKATELIRVSTYSAAGGRDTQHLGSSAVIQGSLCPPRHEQPQGPIRVLPQLLLTNQAMTSKAIFTG